MVTQIYEEATGRRVATSKTIHGQPTGPFVRFTLAFSWLIMQEQKPNAFMIDEFVKWYRSPESEAVREFIADLRPSATRRQCGTRGKPMMKFRSFPPARTQHV